LLFFIKSDCLYPFSFDMRNCFRQASKTVAEASEAYNVLLMLIRDIAIHYNAQIHTMTQSTSTMDFNQVFGDTIDNFYQGKEKIIDGMWRTCVKNDSIDIQAVRKYLGIHDKSTLAYLEDCSASIARRSEYTCEWIQRSLLDFTKSTDDILAVTGPSGSGKSILSGWILERLQRPIGGKMYEVYSIKIGMC
jgi:hypothetical protein